MNTKAVALLIETSNAYARGLVRGIVAYMRKHSPWSIYLPEHGRGDRAPAWLKRFHGDGIIARIENDQIADVVLQANVPVVDVSAAQTIPDIPFVETDDRAIAVLAAEHFLERGFKHFGFCGERRFNWSNLRCRYFKERLESIASVNVYETPAAKQASRSTEVEQKEIAQWIASLPKPVGVMACYDIRGRYVLDACRELDVAVPDEVAVIGVDNDETICELAFPPLSSVIPDTLQTGFKAAQLLDEMMVSKGVRPGAHLIKPLGVETRQSTDVLAIDDHDIAIAIRYIRKHAFEGINVDDLLREVPLSRRALESKFRSQIGRTPYEEIIRVRIERVKQLIDETDMSLSSIASQTGFSRPEHMSAVFKRQTGMTPRDYRSHGETPRSTT